MNVSEYLDSSSWKQMICWGSLTSYVIFLILHKKLLGLGLYKTTLLSTRVLTMFEVYRRNEEFQPFMQCLTYHEYMKSFKQSFT